MTGHLLGGSGGIEAGITVLAIRDQIAPPTINYETGSAVRSGLRAQPGAPHEDRVRPFNSFGFGGTNGCLIFKRYRPEAEPQP